LIKSDDYVPNLLGKDCLDGSLPKHRHDLETALGIIALTRNCGHIINEKGYDKQCVTLINSLLAFCNGYYGGASVEPFLKKYSVIEELLNGYSDSYLKSLLEELLFMAKQLEIFKETSWDESTWIRTMGGNTHIERDTLVKISYVAASGKEITQYFG
jgi:hypothetical protein